MLNTGLIIGFKSIFFEQQLKASTQEFHGTHFKNPDEAYEETWEYFLSNYSDLYRSDFNHNSCMAIRAYESSNQLALGDAKFSQQDFADYLKACSNIFSDGKWFEEKIAQALKNMARNVQFKDVGLFVMNYS